VVNSEYFSRCSTVRGLPFAAFRSGHIFSSIAGQHKNLPAILKAGNTARVLICDRSCSSRLCSSIPLQTSYRRSPVTYTKEREIHLTDQNTWDFRVLMTTRTPAHSDSHSTMYTPDPSTMAHSADQSPALMTQDLPLSVAGRGSREFPKPPVHVTLPPTARTTTRQKPSPSSQAQSPITSEGQLLALDNFFGPAPQRQRSVDIEKQSSEPRNIFEREKEPETVSKYLFYYGFSTHIPTGTSTNCLHLYFL
jgi:hypothetical protein